MKILSLRNNGFWIAIIILILLIMTVNTFGYGESHQASKVALRSAIQSQDYLNREKEKTVLTPLQTKMQKKISVDFKETPIDDVLRSMAAQADIDIVKSPKVIGEVTASLTDIPLEEALNNILSAHAYAFISSKNMIRIVPEADANIAVQKMVNRVYRITYADVREVNEALRGYISEGGKIAYNQGTSNLMVTETEERIEAIDKFIEEVDRMTTQVMVEARLYDIAKSDSLDLGIEWTAGKLTNYSDGVGTLGGASGKTNPFVTGAFSGTTNEATNTESLLRFGFLNDNIDIDAILRAEQEHVDAKLLANPKILVLDNHEALIKIVEEIPFQELTQTAAGGSIGTTEFREVGIELLVIPHVTRDCMIRLDLYPQFSIQTGQIVIPGINNPIPQPVIARREAQTTALIESGCTVVIGGLRKQDVTQQKNKVPLLGDIPLIGGLFSFEGEKIVTSELVIFITPHIVEKPSLSPLEMEQFMDTHIVPPKTPLTRTLRTDIQNECK